MYGIFPYIWLIFMVNVGNYTSPMDPMGMMQTMSQLATLTKQQNQLQKVNIKTLQISYEIYLFHNHLKTPNVLIFSISAH